MIMQDFEKKGLYLQQTIPNMGMKRITICLLALLPAILAGCSMADYGEEMAPVSDAAAYSAIVSVRTAPSGTVYFQVDDRTRLLPFGDTAPYQGLERILCGLLIYADQDAEFGHRADVLWYEALDKGSVSGASIGGDDPLEILSDWMTSCEDGYLTLHYEAWWGESSVPHAFTLVTGLNPDDPYEVRLRHDAKGDGRKEKADSVVYFDLQSLPDSGDEDKTLTLKWINSEGKLAERKFAFRSRRP